MKMHRETYQELMRKFAQELHEVGVTEEMKERINDQCDIVPHVISVGTGPTTISRFVYRHGGYLIEAKNTVELTIKTATP
jgi:hypothetical protein